MWVITSILLACIALISLIYNSIKDTKIDSLEYEVAYLLDIIFNDHDDVVLRLKEDEHTDEQIRDIKEKWDKRIKQVEDINTFGEYIKQLRGETSTRQAAKDIGVSHTYLDSLEKGYDMRTNSKRSPSVVTVNKIAQHYNVDFKQLCDMVINDIDN